jgi:hypothetical protein
VNEVIASVKVSEDLLRQAITAGNMDKFMLCIDGGIPIDLKYPVRIPQL